MIDDIDRSLLFQIVKEACYQNYRQPIDKVCQNLISEGEVLGPPQLRNLFYGNYIDPEAEPKFYDEITDLEDLTAKMNYYLQEYNLISKAPMNLVMFKFAIEHISRIARVLTQPNGNVLLVGMGGSGRHSSIRLAAAMADQNTHEIEITRTYGINEWRDDLKNFC